ncbi:MAG: YfiR family protein [Bacteroidetes bacterium]|nr:YfiR family protein [Bacteroidota bacterium]HNR19739.1 YfiR family protein [Bacteroidia bacterium]HNU31977.1 YfiR family protein [Bacteroidia bacterium]
MLKRLLALSIACLIFFSSQCFSQTNSPEKSKALFVYNFAKYIEWPEDTEAEIFTIGVMGQKEIFTELEKICAGKIINNIPVQVRIIDDPEKISDCKIIYLSKGQNMFFKDMIGLIGNEKILLVAEGKEMVKQGADISMVKQEERMAFEINKESINKKGLKVPNELMVLAINMDKRVF